jgi:hypothetical protein
MRGTRRGLQRRHLIKRIEYLEYIVSTLMNNNHNFEMLFNYYVEMNGDVDKFTKHLDKKSEDAESPESKPK